MIAAASLPPAGTMRPLTYAMLFGLLAATGVRISEALALRLRDVAGDGFIVGKTKFHEELVHSASCHNPEGVERLSLRRACRSPLAATPSSSRTPDRRRPTIPRPRCSGAWRARSGSVEAPVSPGRASMICDTARGPIARTVCVRPRCGLPPDRRAQHLPRPCPRYRHLLVSPGDTDPDGPDRRGR